MPPSASSACTGSWHDCYSAPTPAPPRAHPLGIYPSATGSTPICTNSYMRRRPRIWKPTASTSPSPGNPHQLGSRIPAFRPALRRSTAASSHSMPRTDQSPPSSPTCSTWTTPVSSSRSRPSAPPHRTPSSSSHPPQADAPHDRESWPHGAFNSSTRNSSYGNIKSPSWQVAASAPFGTHSTKRASHSADAAQPATWRRASRAPGWKRSTTTRGARHLTSRANWAFAKTT